jgi:hypothetical protein
MNKCFVQKDTLARLAHEGNQRQVTSALDGPGKLALVLSARRCLSSRPNLPAIGQELF